MWKLPFALLTSFLGTSDGATAAGGMAMKTQGQSGKITLYNESAGDSDPNKVVIAMSAVREVDDQGNAVGTGGNTKHSVNTLASQTFTWGGLEDHTFEGGVTAKTTSFSAAISTVGTFGVQIFMMTSSGTVGPASEGWTVAAGDLKFNVFFPEAWTWCAGDVCKQGQTTEIGAYIDVEIEIKGQGTAKAKGSSNNSLDLGGGVGLLLTDVVNIDGTDTTMPEGYPKFAMQGSKQVFTFRFPKFSANATYDPVLSASGVGEDEGGDDDTDTDGASILFSSTFWLALLGFSAFALQ